MVEKGINFIFYLGTAYDVSSMESVGMLQVIFVGRKSMPLKNNKAHRAQKDISEALEKFHSL